ncbi:MAG: DUF975 family protein [Oscillospiraceae bacterium]|nr:DUF975 family protein [Oscillospiraceae bacterium]
MKEKGTDGCTPVKFSQERKQQKKRGRRVLRKHYFPLLLVFIIMVFIGTEFSGLTLGVSATKPKETQVTESSGKALWNEVTSGALRADTGNWASHAAQNYLQKKQDAVENYSTEGHSVLGIDYSRGALASVVNVVSSGRLDMVLIRAVSTLTKSDGAGVIVQVIVATIVQVGAWILVFNIISVAGRRMFLLSRMYDRVRLASLTDIITFKAWGKASMTMFLKWLFKKLWDFTIIGGIIKRYSYYLVPYIVAENPKIGSREAITLSRRMMNGHKWECFIYELSFLPWFLLGCVTFGISEVFYSTPYKLCAMSEYYVYLRALAKEKCIPGVEKLNDTYLFEKPEQEVLEAVYSDIQEHNSFIAAHDMQLTGFRGFLVRNFGIWTYSRAERQRYHHVEVRKYRVMTENMILAGQMYPLRLNPYYRTNRKAVKYSEGASFLKASSIGTIILMFFAFAFVGWLWEVSLHVIKDAAFVNRGVMHGPWLPIYGSGGVMMLILLKRFRNKPLLEISLMLLLSGVLEYTTSVVLELTTGLKYWDYSGYYLNLNGRVCAEGLIIFTIAGILVVYLLAPALDGLFIKIPRKATVALCTVLIVIFGADFVYSHYRPNSGEGITDYEEYVPELQQPAAEIQS